MVAQSTDRPAAVAWLSSSGGAASWPASSSVYAWSSARSPARLTGGLGAFTRRVGELRAHDRVPPRRSLRRARWLRRRARVRVRARPRRIPRARPRAASAISGPRSRAISASSAARSRAASAISGARSRATSANSRLVLEQHAGRGPASRRTRCRPEPTGGRADRQGRADASDTLRAARRPRQPSDGLPSVSTAAMISPPSRLRSVMKARRSSALRCGSASFQNMWPPTLPGMTVNASAAEASRGSLPVASSSPPPICTAALTRAKVSAFDGRSGRSGRAAAHPVERGPGGVGGGLGVAKGIHPLPDEGH